MQGFPQYYFMYAPAPIPSNRQQVSLLSIHYR